MIDLLTSMTIVSLVLLSLLQYQISMLHHTEEVQFKTIATLQLMNFADALQSNTTSRLRHVALKVWNKDNARLLPQSSGDYTRSGDHLCVITLNWFFKQANTQTLSVFC